MSWPIVAWYQIAIPAKQVGPRNHQSNATLLLLVHCAAEPGAAPTPNASARHLQVDFRRVPLQKPSPEAQKRRALTPHHLLLPEGELFLGTYAE